MRISRFLVPALLTTLPWMARAQPADPYTFCSFYPQGAPCGQVYQQALKDNSSPAAGSVRDAFGSYARYLKPPASLGDQDRAWLKNNDITEPGLTQANLGGLHNVINDPTLTKDPASQRAAVNNFITRALEAELFCGFNNCGDQAGAGG
jgi:hypothetical protein